MDQLTSSAAAGMRARLETLDLLANNIANSSTSGFKADRESFLPWVGEDADADSGATVAPFLKRQWTDFAQGTLSRTSGPLDVALQGRGFFEVNDGSKRLWTRNGAFQLGADGKLQTVEGYSLRVVPATGGDYRLNPLLPIEIDGRGNIRQDGRAVGRIDTAEFSDLSVLAKQGSTYFKVEDSTLAPNRSTSSSFHQGYLESANGAAIESSVRLVGVMRQFESLQRATTIGAEMNKRSIEEVAKVSG
ncbi:flagellar basal-body rod protein FlgF [Bryobacterales bacterium F-183]|nr:flagellar basal-body rod protein FlgF [Bryobacterales bacterium F-183]